MDKPPFRFDVRTTQGQLAAQDCQEKMAALLPFEKRHRWLTTHGWQELPQTGARHRLYIHDKVAGRYNQTRAVLVECYNIMIQKGIIYRAQ